MVVAFSKVEFMVAMMRAVKRRLRMKKVLPYQFTGYNQGKTDDGPTPCMNNFHKHRFMISYEGHSLSGIKTIIHPHISHVFQYLIDNATNSLPTLSPSVMSLDTLYIVHAHCRLLYVMYSRITILQVVQCARVIFRLPCVVQIYTVYNIIQHGPDLFRSQWAL